MRRATAVFILSGRQAAGPAAANAETPPQPRGEGGEGSGDRGYRGRAKIWGNFRVKRRIIPWERGRIYPKGLKRIRVEMAELGGKIGVKVRGYINIGLVI